jgi:hypothetical protein
VKNLTDDNTTDAVEGAGESTSEEDSDLVKDLRKQLKDKARELKSAPSRSEIEADIRASVAREKAIESQLTALKLPAGLSETVEGKLGDAEVTREKVVEVLTAIGFTIAESTDGGESQPQQTAEDLAAVASLGNQVANAASQPDSDNLTDKVNQAESTAEIAELMREAGLGQ